MKVSINVMKQYSGDEQWQLPVPELVRKIGAQLGAVEETINVGAKYGHIIIGDIVQATPHVGADKLNVYQVFDGQKNTQVVSGDKAIQVGDKVAWLQPGATVPATWGTSDPFILGVRDMRGEPSHGMFGSGKELDINDDHKGVLILDTDAPAGTPFAQAYNLAGDAIIDIENKMFTHRPDGFGHLGVAREIAGIQGLPFTSPDWYTHSATLPQSEADLPLTVKNDIPALVPRFVAVAVQNVTIGPSPLWLQASLHTLGIRPINNIVDITNYYMVLTGQPLHAYDYDKVAALAGGKAHLTVRHPKKNESITLLNGKEITPHAGAMIVAAGDAAACVGGMIGGANSEIDATTKNIILEAATWDMFEIRRTSMQHGIFTDAVTRFSKGQSPLQNVAVIAKALQEIQSLAGGRIGSGVDDVHLAPDVLHRGSVHPPVAVSADFINARLGTHLSAADIATTLGNVEMSAEEHGNELFITAPFWRTDIEIPEDIVEEVGRLRGYDTLPHSLPTRTTSAVRTVRMDVLKTRIRTILSQAGANELQTYTFVPARLLQQVGQDKTHAFTIRNALSPDLQHYRLSLTPSLLEKVHANIKSGYRQFGLFEMNKIHIKGDDDCDGLPREYQTLAFVFASDTAVPGAAYYQAKRYLDYVLAQIGIDPQYQPVTDAPGFEVGRQVFAPFEPKRSANVFVNGQDFAGFIGEYRAAVSKNLKLPVVVAGFEIDLERILKHQRPTQYQPLLKFPATDQDVCLKVTNDVTYGQIVQVVRQALAGDKRLRVTIESLDIYQRQDDAARKQITLRISLQHHDKTLTTAEVNNVLDVVVAHVAETTGAERI